MDDKRTECFLHLIQSVLPIMQNKPRFLLIENVRGFEDSDTRQILVQVMRQLEFHFREFLISPKQIGIPNSRLRYYMIARLEKDFVSIPNTLIDSIADAELEFDCPVCRRSLSTIMVAKGDAQEVDSCNQVLESFLCQNIAPCFYLSEKQLKYTQGLDIVRSGSRNTCCFTKGYAHLLLGSGSVLQTNELLDPDFVLKSVTPDSIDALLQLGLRFFTPREIANLMCFPQNFSFPEHITDRQKYRLLGNSVNVRVVALILMLLFAT